MEAKYDEKAKQLTLTLHVDLKAGTRSASGKSVVLYSTRGNKPLDCLGAGTYVGINIYTKA